MRSGSRLSNPPADKPSSSFPASAGSKAKPQAQVRRSSALDRIPRAAYAGLGSLWSMASREGQRGGACRDDPARSGRAVRRQHVAGVAGRDSHPLPQIAAADRTFQANFLRARAGERISICRYDLSRSKWMSPLMIHSAPEDQAHARTLSSEGSSLMTGWSGTSG